MYIIRFKRKIQTLSLSLIYNYSALVWDIRDVFFFNILLTTIILAVTPLFILLSSFTQSVLSLDLSWHHIHLFLRLFSLVCVLPSFNMPTLTYVCTLFYPVTTGAPKDFHNIFIKLLSLTKIYT